MNKLKLLEQCGDWGLKLLSIRLYMFKIKHFIKLYHSVEKTVLKVQCCLKKKKKKTLKGQRRASRQVRLLYSW